MTMDRDALLRQVLTTHDDNVRLVYADWLEEQGQLAHAELVRAQCTLAAQPPWTRAAVQAGWRADAELAACGDAVRKALPALEGVEWTDFERGLPSTVRVKDVATLVRHAAAIADAAPVYRAHLDQLDEPEPYVRGSVPWLRALRIANEVATTPHATSSILDGIQILELDDVEEYRLVEWLSQRDSIAELARIRIRGQHVVGRSLVDGIAAQRWAAGLTAFEIGTTFVDYDTGYFEDPTLREAGAQALSSFPRLEVLDIARQRVGDAGLATVLCDLPALRELDARASEATSLAAFAGATGASIVRLDLGHNTFGDAGARVLALAPRLASVESLVLDTCEISATGVRAITAAPFWSTLRVLDLSRNPLGDEGVRALAEAPPPPHLHTLCIADVDMTGAGAATLLVTPWLRQLLVLDVSANALRGCEPLLGALAGGSLGKLVANKCELVDVAALAPLLPQLVHLALRGAIVGAEGVAALFSTLAPELQHLDLEDCALDGEAFRQLCTAPLPRLRWLDVSRNKLHPRSLEYLLRESPLAEQLEHLAISHANQSSDLAHALATTTRLSRLHTLALRGVELSEEQLWMLARSVPLARVRALLLSVDVWRFGQATRDALFARFGRGWWYDESDEDDGHPT